MIRPFIVEVTDPSLGLKNGNRIFTSLEGENPGGSMKDHMVLGEIERLLKQNKKWTGISEVSAGSTAKSLAHYCPLYGLECVLFVPTTASVPLLQSLRDAGAEVYQEELKEIYQKYDVFSQTRKNLAPFNQLFDSGKRFHYFSFGAEVKHELGVVHAVIGAVGTGHSLLGIAAGIDDAVNVISAEPEASFKIAGVRNVTVDRYGEKDVLAAEDFSNRMIVAPEHTLPEGLLQTDAGMVHFGPSYGLVLAAAKEYTADKKGQIIFTVGASLKRIQVDILDKTA